MSIATPVATKQIPVARPYFGQEEEQAVAEVLRSGWVTTGPRVAELERRFAEYVEAAYAVAVSSCTTGLHMAMVASGIGAGHDVLCPSFSFIATANCIRYAGASPIFVDIDRSSYNIDPNRLEEAITPQTRAILVAHQIGLPAAMDEILEIAEGEMRKLSLDDLRRGVAATIACRAAIKVNMKLDQNKMEWLLSALAATDCPMSCPHGRPIALRYSMREILRSFHRI